jgi:NADPH:quinone reductase-like Zn-dependent oxidoreductase
VACVASWNSTMGSTRGRRLGALRPAIDSVFALDDILEAHRHLEEGLQTDGKIVVAV